MNGIIAQHIGHIVRGHSRVIDTDKFHIGTVNCSAKCQASNPSKSVNTDFDTHISNLPSFSTDIFYYTPLFTD
ncbi:hypothetical protein SDC9_92729 [bioreactor metagenome]|uniref:Uncharacterized protein n=1 Tax=bioreactor metagenome TaxID=1076179 RepID=A0A644ZYL3_9ZZZZ